MDGIQQERERLHKRADELANQIANAKMLLDYDVLEAATDELDHVCDRLREIELLPSHGPA